MTAIPLEPVLGGSSIQVLLCPSRRTVIELELAFVPQEQLLSAVMRALTLVPIRDQPPSQDPLQNLGPVLQSLGLQDFIPQDPDKGSLMALEQGVLQGLEHKQLFISVWGRPQALNHLLQVGDRVELTRALRVDPKVARRERFRQQGAKTAGLFTHQRPNGKAGY